jgi:hypothetical protein
MVGMILVTDRLNRKERAHRFVKRGGGCVNVTGYYWGVGARGYGTNSPKRYPTHNIGTPASQPTSCDNQKLSCMRHLGCRWCPKDKKANSVIIGTWDCGNETPAQPYPMPVGVFTSTQWTWKLQGCVGWHTARYLFLARLQHAFKPRDLPAEGSARLANLSQRPINSIMRVCHTPNDFVPFPNCFPFHTFLQFSSLLLCKALLIRRRINAVTFEGIDTGLDRFSGASLTLF